jgi:RES domain-containing protein
MEVLANADELADDYVVTPIDVPDDLEVTRYSVGGLPLGWDANEPAPATRDIGTHWANARATPVLCVPSAVIPREWNYLLNPTHPDFIEIRFLGQEPFYFDDRLGRAWLQ